METKENVKKSNLQERREKLLIISNEARTIRDKLAEKENDPLKQMAILDTSLNYIITRYIYGIKSELKTFKQWKDEGRRIKKGSKSYILWGRPVRSKKKETETEPESKNYKFFPIVYLFSAEQVEQN
jgi:hypothetical protein